jgi:CCR4-NOT transcription complex subunit 2
MPPPSLKAEHMNKFLVETLFYMFYALPRDVLQITAAQELYRREWRYHGEMRLWLKPRTPQEQMQSHPSMQYVYFDPGVWEVRLFTTNTRTPVVTGFLSGILISLPPSFFSEDDLRGKMLGGPSAPGSSLSLVGGVSS